MPVMASVYRHGANWRVQVYIGGVRDSAVLPTRQEATKWGVQREGELSGRKLPDKTFLDAIDLYKEEVAPTHKGSRWELVRLTSLSKEPIAKRKLAGLSCDDFALWRDSRVKVVKPSTAAREMNLMRSVLEHVRRTPYRWIRENPMSEVKWPASPPARRRRVMPDEVAEIRLAFGVGSGYQSATITQRVGLAFLFALETAMRSSEIVKLQWSDVHLSSRYVSLEATKNDDKREVPLSTVACDILRALPGNEGSVFDLNDMIRDAIWRKYRPASLKNLTFHDSRGEAIWRLSKKLDVLQLAQVIGHRDLKSLMHYYRESAADMAKRLG